MGKLLFLFIGKFILPLVLVPLPSDALAPWAIITTGKEVLDITLSAYNALESLHADVVKTGVEELTPGQGAALRKLDSIYWDLTDLKADIKNWQIREETNEVAAKIDELLAIIDEVDDKYKTYERLRFNNSFYDNNVLVKAEPDRIERFAKSCISEERKEFPAIIKEMYKVLTHQGASRKSVLSTLTSHSKKIDFMCLRNQTHHQLILELFRSVVDADKKGLILKLYAFDELEKSKKLGPHYFNYSRITEKEEFKARIDNTKAIVKRYLGNAPRELWTCDPPKHEKDVTYAKLQEIFQTYAFYEEDSHFNCQKECPEYSNTTPACKTYFCNQHSERKRCYGKLKDCQKIHKTQTYCFAPETSDRRYEWMMTGANTSYGPYDIDCEDIVPVKQSFTFTSTIVGYIVLTDTNVCDTCLCTCVSNEQGIDRYFSLKPVYADVEENKVVTGIRFFKNDYVLSLQIQQGKLAANGTIDQDTLEWKNETDSAEDGLYDVTEERNTVFLDDILYPPVDINNRTHRHEHFVVSGVKLEEMDNSLRLKVSFVPFDFKTGTVYYNESSLQFYGNNKRKDKRKSLTCCSYSAAGTGGLAGSSVLVKVDNRPGSANSGSYATIADLEPLYARPCGSRASYYAASHVTHLSQSTDPCEKARAVAVPRSALHCRSAVQEGTFGRVYRGSWKQAGREQEVIIKTVTDVASAYQASLLVVEGSQLAGLVHGNIATLAAACLEGSCPMLAYACSPSELNLKTYLTGGEHHPVTRDLVNVAVQVARAGAFLHGRGILHKDIATRNCMVDTSTLRTRLADAALSRDLFPQDYHCLGDNENRAIGWMALETLQHGQYSTASDTWSFGVFLWELATMGQQPYLEVDPFELTAFLRDGYRLSQPRPCPDELFAVMAVCWLGPTRDRPTMPQLLAYLQEFYDALGGFI